MIVRVTIKDPDSLCDAVNDAAEEELEKLGLPEDEKKLLFVARAEKARTAICEKWVRYGEYYLLEFNTETGTATVLEQPE